MLKKNDLTGFEKEYIWVDLENDKFFQFYLDGTGMMSNTVGNTTSVRWEYLDDKSALRIGHDGIIFYYIFKKQNKDDFQVSFKSKSGSKDISLSRVVKPKNNVQKASSLTEDEDVSKIVKDKFSFNKLETSDKAFLSFMFIVSLILFTILIKMALFFNSASILMTLFLALFCTTALFVYLRDVLYFVSKKYKKEIEDIIFKK